MNKKNVAVVMGGYSDEYKVSLKSGQLIYDSLDRELYNVRDCKSLMVDERMKKEGSIIEIRN